MSKSRIFTISLVAATVAGVILNFNSPSIGDLCSRLLITLLITLPVFYFTIIMVRSYIHKPTIIKTVLGILIVLFIGIIILGSITYFSNQNLCLQVVTGYSHFRTNPFTGQCSYGGAQSDSCAKQEPWYYKDGCASVEKKIETIQQSSLGDSIEFSCQQYCEKNIVEKFCDDYSLGSNRTLTDIHCDQLVECSTITCENK